MLAALPFAHHSQLSCDCIAVQAHDPRIVAVGSYELLTSAPASGSDTTLSSSGDVGVGGQMRTGAVDFFEVDGEALRHLHHFPCAAGVYPPLSLLHDSHPHNPNQFLTLTGRLLQTHALQPPAPTAPFSS